MAGGTTCRPPDIDTIMEVPAWFDPVTVPIWRPDVADDLRVRDALAAHVTVQSIAATRADLPTQNTLVYFADWRSDKPLAELGAALDKLQRRRMALAIIIVVPRGTFDERRKELEAKLVPIGERFTAQLHITEDDDGGWTRTFAPSRLPAIFLINARRQFVWKHDGTPEAKDLQSALDRFLDAAPPRVLTPLRLRISPGDVAPDVSFEDDRGQEFALHRLNGQCVLVNFGQSWSDPSRKELRHLQSRYDRAQREGTFIVGVLGGNKYGLEQIRKDLGLSFPLVQDADQRIATAFGVRCWPTTITIDAEGRIEHIQLGVTHEHARTLSDREQREETPGWG